MTPRLTSVAIVRTGSANLASISAAFARHGVESSVTESPEEVAGCSALILPGVGEFGSAMKRLHDLGLVEALRTRIEDGQPTLAICLGMQLLCESSEESPGMDGLGVIPHCVRRFNGAVRVPHMGWNEVSADPGCALLQSGFACFANSYRLDEAPRGWSTCWTDYAGPFVSAIERDSILACQFHPELSGEWGASLIARWLATSGFAVRSSRANTC